MQASARHAGKCVFCTFRLRLKLKTGPKTSFQRSFLTATPLRSRSDSQNTKPRLKVTRSWSPRPRGRGKGNDYGPKPNFAQVLRDRLAEVKSELQLAPIARQLGPNDADFASIWRAFVSSIMAMGQGPATTNPAVLDQKKEYQALRDAFYDQGIPSLDNRLKYAFYDHVTGSRFTESDIRNQKALADLRYPTEWFPATRAIHRTIHLHVGPTNSGKTYHALKRLEQADTGVYAGPLRLLAHEVYTRFNAKGKRCTLITGEEKRSPDDSLSSSMSSCTVEMMPLNKDLDVAVIDEIQMIGNPERGWAWTQAVLGVRAKEVHLCGETRTVPLIRELCASVGEKLVVHEYQRLSPLKMADQSLHGNLKLLRKGDCIVSFSVIGIHALRTQIELATGRKVATVYGSLPPETRAQQARLFNDPDNDYDFLVASDAIGMGLNLSIKRIIFEASSKYDGYKQKPLAIADIKQIGGRAGRYKSAHQDNESARNTRDVAAANGEQVASLENGSSQPSHHHVDATDASHPRPGSSELASASLSHSDDKSTTKSTLDTAVSARPSSSSVGLVTTLEKFDFPIISAGMKGEPEPIRTAGILPPAPVIERFATYFPPGTPFSYILLRLHDLSQVHSRFHLCRLKDQLWIADLIEPVQGLTTNDRNILCACPASQSEPLFKLLIPAFARCIEQQSGGALFDMPEIPLETLELEVSAKRNYLRQLEQLHKSIIAYLWLSYRFAGIFNTRPLAFHVKTLVEEKIEQVLSQFSFTEARRRQVTATREKLLLERLKEEAEPDATEPRGDAVPEDLINKITSGPETQTSYAAGGNRFSGEDDAVVIDPIEEIGIDEPASGSEAVTSAVSSAPEDLPSKNHPQQSR